MQITREILEKNKAALVAERDGYLAEAERLGAQATGCEGAIRVVDHMLAVLDKPEDAKRKAGTRKCTTCGDHTADYVLIYTNSSEGPEVMELCPKCRKMDETYDLPERRPQEARND